MDAISMRYAESLFGLALEENAVAAYQTDMQLIQSVFQDPSFVQFFSHVALQDDVKFNVLNKSFNGKISIYVYNFLMLLIKKRRIQYILGICHQFQRLCNDHFGIKEGIIYSAFELSDQERQDIEKAMSQKEGLDVKLIVKVDSSLIGGIKVDIDNHIYDDSLLYKMETLKKELLGK